MKIVFLYDLIDKLVYVNISKGSKTKANQNMVYKLLIALYGLKQSNNLCDSGIKGYQDSSNKSLAYYK